MTFLPYFGKFWTPKHHYIFMRCNKTDDDFKFDVWEEKCDISFKDQSI